MGRYALVEEKTGLVENVIMLEIGSGWELPVERILVSADTEGNIGDTWNGSKFVTPEYVVSEPVKTVEDYKLEYNAPGTTEKRKTEILEILVGLRGPEIKPS